MLVLYGASGSPSAAAERVTALAVLAGLFRLRTVHLCAPSRCERRADRLVECCWCDSDGASEAVAQRVQLACDVLMRYDALSSARLVLRAQSRRESTRVSRS